MSRLFLLLMLPLRLRPCSRAECIYIWLHRLLPFQLESCMLSQVNLQAVLTFLAFSAQCSKLRRMPSPLFLVCLRAAFLLAARATSSRESCDLEPLRELLTPFGGLCPSCVRASSCSIYIYHRCLWTRGRKPSELLDCNSFTSGP